jgi:signal peptidase II
MDGPPADANPPRRLIWVIAFFVIAGVALTGDLWLKAWSWDRFVAFETVIDDRPEPIRNNEPNITLIPNGLRLTAVANHGAALGMGQGKRTLFLTVSVVATLAVIGFFAHSLTRHGSVGSPLRLGVYRVTLALLLAGVLGNLYDRVEYGYVRDMLHMFPEVRWSDLWSILPDFELFPWVFNVADVCLCTGVAVILVVGVFPPREVGEERDDA